MTREDPYAEEYLVADYSTIGDARSHRVHEPCSNGSSDGSADQPRPVATEVEGILRSKKKVVNILGHIGG